MKAAAHSIRTQVTEVFSSERGRSGRSGHASQQDLQQSTIMTPEEARSMINALGHVFRGCVEHKVDESGASLIAALNATTEASEDTAAVLARCWASSEVARTSSDAPKQAFNIGNLVKLEWKLGVSVASSSCSSLLAPFVTLLFQVKDGNGDISTQRVELTLAEFQGMSKTLNDVASKLDKL
jgi:hypothetical protein